MKRTLLSLLCVLFSLAALADEGMWLPSLISGRIDDMRSKGFRLTAEDIYSINQASMKDAVVLFNGGCTGELVSPDGLLLTNHHCGYGAIQKHSTIEHDYLTNGFWAKSRAEELPNEKLYVRFLVRMDDVTERLAKGETKEAIIAAAKAEGKNYRASIEQMYYGNQQFLFVYEQFDDVRLVGAPPSSIGKFGGDTDNWMWPRHTGDFSIFRVYADQENRPAAYSPDNVPYHPKRHFKVSTDGIAEGDFTMIYGFPGNTQEYVTSDAVAYIAEQADPAKIAIRTDRLDIINEAQDEDPELRIFYASKRANISNSWKKWQGEKWGVERNGVVAAKRTYEQAFAAWAENKPEYRDIVNELETEYARIEDAYYAREITRETIGALPKKYTAKELTDPIFEKRKPLERALFGALSTAYANESQRFIRQEGDPKKEFYDALRLDSFFTGQEAEAANGDPYQYGVNLFESLAKGDTTSMAKLYASVDSLDRRVAKILGEKPKRNIGSKKLDSLYRIYIRGLREWDTQRAFYPDANLTLRVAYGKVAGYTDIDSTYLRPVSTLDEIIAKDNPEIYDYNIPQTLRDLYATKDYGRWGVEIDGVYTIPVCFLATNHTTGGNSGSPVLNADGELLGLNFDRTWLSTVSDLAFDETVCRNIAVDIRYVLFVIDRIGGADYLFDEMDFSGSK